MADPSGALAAALHRLDLEAALPHAARRNDLLLDRIEDKVYGQIRAGWLASLIDRIRTGKFFPTRAETVYVPKTRFATRPAALITLEDRVVLEALTSAARKKIERALVSGDRLYWPRGERGDKRWSDFERYPLSKRETSHIVMADVAGFYESIDHEVLRLSLLTATGWQDLSDAVASFLTALMGEGRGLPQGVDASDTLATLYLYPVDSELVTAGLDYIRHGDDMRIASNNYKDGLAAAHLLETEIRKRALLPNSGKLQVRRRDNYHGDLQDVDDAVNELKEAWRESAAETILAGGEDFDVTELFEEIESSDTDFEELGWDWYHGDISVEEIVEIIKPHLTADTLSVARKLLADTMNLRPGGSTGRESQLSRD